MCDTLISDLTGLSPYFTLVFHDYRGSGQSSTAPMDTYTFDRLADDLEELRWHLNLGSVPVLAHSMGGLVAMEFALRHESANSLILAGVTPCMSPASTAAPVIKALGPRRTVRMAALALWFLVAWSWRAARLTIGLRILGSALASAPSKQVIWLQARSAPVMSEPRTDSRPIAKGERDHPAMRILGLFRLSAIRR